ncbi:zinc finger protein 532-like [Aphis craccivora]|uniref:Zinc finger protein 532-like n=1 Tax=Aphis craccivora TaxID=307492 RepID=A0A6G0Y2V9_APHCR|nr:zinc finger protein 532-like [Aphis craccivora]
MLRHVKSHKHIQLTCGNCKQDFTRRSNLLDHIQSKHGMYFI